MDHAWAVYLNMFLRILFKNFSKYQFSALTTAKPLVSGRFLTLNF